MLAKPLRIQSADASEIVLHDMGGSGPALFICHATGFHGRAYSSLAAPLLDEYSVWALDFRGHGDSPAPRSDDFGWTCMADDLLACIDAVGESEPVVAFGHSMGGAAILIAERARPESIRAAYLFEPIVFPSDVLSSRSENSLADSAGRRRASFDSKAEVLWRYASRPPLNVMRADALHDYVEFGFVEVNDGTVRLACEPAAEARTFECDGHMALDQLAGLGLRGVVGAGAAGKGPNPAQFAPAIADAVDGMSLRLYDQLGHFGPFQAPGLIAEEVKDALR